MSHLSPAHARDSIVLSITKSAESDSTKIALCASLELATCRAENCQLKEKLAECEATIHSLKQLITRISTKQSEIYTELVELRKKCLTVPRPPAEIDTLDTSTSTVEDDIPDWGSYMPEWDLMQYSGEGSPLASSSSTTSELYLFQEDSEVDPNYMASWRRNQAVEEDEGEEEDDSDGEDNENEDSQHMSQLSHQFLQDDWDDESDN
ncbi:hypothetical protein KR032_009989 [Drosophila birchii]|nr:hypothetical protein KR032_009989 [Drosophila birchii]